MPTGITIPSSIKPKALLLVHDEVDTWESAALSFIRQLESETLLDTTVLLPTDIQLEDYELHHRVLVHSAATAYLEEFVTKRSDTPCLCFVDLFPDPFPDDTGFVDALNRALKNGLGHNIILAVYTPSITDLNTYSFDECLKI